MAQRAFVQTGIGLPEYLVTIALMVPDNVLGMLRRPLGELS